MIARPTAAPRARRAIPGLLAFAALVGALLAPAAAGAQAEWPTRPVRVVVPLAAGGVLDTITRLLGAEIGRRLGQPVVVENRPGAAGAVGAAAVAKGAPDGYLLCSCANASFTLLPHTQPALGYDPARELLPVAALYAVDVFLAVRADDPSATLADLVAAARARPGRVAYGSNGPGSGAHLVGATLEDAARVQLLHVPYKGEQQALAGLLGGEVDVAIVSAATAATQLKAGRVRLLATASAARSAVLPEVPTAAEAGVPGLRSEIWAALLAPAGTPPAVVERLRSATAATLQDPAIAERLVALGASPARTPPAALEQAVRAESERMAALAKRLGLGSN
ncbi:MAG: hypothetical protein RJA99_1094 [Pseudomonadota bacterium]|jgi:tripartite-type tricarboxylate transporter receptor subunit TctC